MSRPVLPSKFVGNDAADRLAAADRLIKVRSIVRSVSATAAAVALLSFLAVPSFTQEKGDGKQGKAGKQAKQGKQAIPERPVEQVPRWPDGRANLGSAPGKAGFWELRPGLNGFPRPQDVPFQPWAKALYDYRQNVARPPLVECKPGPGPSFLNAPGFEIIDTPELKSVFIINIAGAHSWRVIYTDGRQHPKSEDLRPTYLGHSIGHWEGDTLVIDTVGFNEKQWPIGSYPSTEQLHMIEKFTRPTLGSLTYEATIDDPGAYTKPWGGKWDISEKTLSKFTAGEPFEYICEDDR